MSLLRTAIFVVSSGLFAVAGVTGCGEDAASSGDGGSGQTGGGGSGAGQGGSGGQGAMPPTPTQMTISGDITWDVKFDAEAQTAGSTDCSYTRHYEGVEDQSAPWLCPSCEVIFRANVQLTSGLNDCFSQISMSSPATQEWIGYGNGTWWRSSDGALTEQGTAVVSDGAVSSANSVVDLEGPLGGLFGFDIAGNFALAEQDGDPLHGFVAASSYSCGWPKADPPAYTGDYSIAMGQTVPDGLFLDSCGEVVRLHDFQGSYLIIDMSAMDCPPCQTMAAQEEQFVADMAAQGIEVHVITLLAPSLGNVYGETTNTMLNTWINNYNLTAPVLADRGWGLSMFLPLFDGGGAYPSWVLVDPNLNVFGSGEGFGGYTEVADAILADAGQ